MQRLQTSSAPPALSEQQLSHLPWDSLRRCRAVTGHQMVPVELYNTAQHCGLRDERLLPLLRTSSWHGTLARGYLRDNFFRLIDGIPSELPEHATERVLSSGPIQNLVSFLSQGFDIERARLAGIAAYGQAMQALPHGTLDTDPAHECLYDQLRTKRFVAATVAHLEDILHYSGNNVVRAVDAGCGPIPVLAIAAALYSPRVAVLALESNPISADIARHVVETFGLAGQIEVQNTDAATVKLAQPADLVVSETIETALTSESLGAIIDNLRPQLALNGRVIPEQVTISRGYARANAEQSHFFTYRALQRCDAVPVPHDIDFAPVYTWTPHASALEAIRIPVNIRAEDLLPGGYSSVYLSTHISLYRGRAGKESIELAASESVITRPIYLITKYDAWQRLVRQYDPEPPSKDNGYDVSYIYAPGHAKRLQVTCPELEFRRRLPGGPAD